MATALGNMTLNTLIEPAPPYDAEIEYLESTGTQYIDTGVAATNADEIVVVTKMPVVTNRTGVFGYRTSASEDFCIMQTGSTGLYDVFFSNGSDYASYSANATATTTARVRLTASASLREIYDMDAGVALASSTTRMQTAFTTAGNCLLFKNGGNPFATDGFVGRFYALVWRRNGTLVRDFIPVRVGSVGYLYDRVSGALFGNAGTGDFVLGNDIDVHNALTKANTNFDNIKHWFTDATFSFKPTITFKSGWSASSDIEFRIVNGRIAHVAGNIKCTSALTAGTSYTPFSAFSFPTGVNYYAGCRLGANQRVWIYFNGTSTTIIPEVNIDANTNIYLRGLIPMTLTPGTATSYVKHIAPLF